MDSDDAVDAPGGIWMTERKHQIVNMLDQDAVKGCELLLSL